MWFKIIPQFPSLAPFDFRRRNPGIARLKAARGRTSAGRAPGAQTCSGLMDAGEPGAHPESTFNTSSSSVCVFGPSRYIVGFRNIMRALPA